MHIGLVIKLGIFANNQKLGTLAAITEGIKTGDNNRFLRLWHEVSCHKSSLFLHENKKWIPYHKGGEYRRWYGNLDYVINWENGGEEIRLNSNSGLQGKSNYFSEGITWSKLSSTYFGVRFLPEGVLFDSISPSIFPIEKCSIYSMLGFLSSRVGSYIINILNPTLAFQVGNVASMPFINVNVDKNVEKLINLSKSDWDNYENSWNFNENPLSRQKQLSLKHAFELWKTKTHEKHNEIRVLEEENNRFFINSYGLQDELFPEVTEDQITLNHSDQEKDIQRLISYAIGCMMGRYSLDEPGLIYAHAGNVDFDPSRYPSFPADEDGILPLTDQEWFKDDASNRFREFLVAVWGENTLQQNLEFVAESLTLSSFKPKKGETSLDTVRRYLSNQFYKDHLQTYKKRPIYWLFSSGKQKAFECLVYLHRYNDSTLARMRTEYVTPLLGKYSAYADQLTQQLQDASSSEATRIKKDMLALEKKQTELRQFDDKLKHYADRRIKLDLDDGVKVNYGKFGDLLAEVKAVTGGAGD